MAVRLEPVYLANVLLHIENCLSLRAFPFVSKNCREATLTLKTNPAWFAHSPRTILRLFPNINTMVVATFSSLEACTSLPDTVASVVVLWMSYNDLTRKSLRFADRVVDIREFDTTDFTPTDERIHKKRDTFDFSRFTRLTRLSLKDLRAVLVMPSHRLKTVRVLWTYGKDPFPPALVESAELVVVVCDSVRKFSVAHARPAPPNVRVVCTRAGAHVAPRDFWPMGTQGSIALTRTFGTHELHAFDRAVLLPYRRILLSCETDDVECDISFLTTVREAFVVKLNDALLTLPTSLVHLTLDNAVEQVVVTGTASLTSLVVLNRRVAVDPCPALQEFDGHRGVLSLETAPF